MFYNNGREMTAMALLLFIEICLLLIHAAAMKTECFIFNVKSFLCEKLPK